ncbi:MAG: DUF4405 domain-containing protein [Desulforegulaceae bacterium]|nr:DUF4405 domain-containing protein [Desulforegulaceae bacterium]
MKLSRIKFFTSSALYLTFSTLFFTGFFLYAVIPSGNCYHTFFLGLARYEWKNIHSFFGAASLLLICLHVFLNLSVVKSMIKKELAGKPILTVILALGFIPLTIISLIVRWIV